MSKIYEYCDLLEKVAELEHEQWIHWSKDIAPELANTKENVERIQRWNELWKPYSRLNEEYKKKDRQWARKVLNIVPMGNLKDWQLRIYRQYVKDEKHLIWKGKGSVGDIAELGLICEEIGEAMNGIRKRKGIKNLREECGDILARTLCFMSRNGIDAEQALREIHEKNVKRNRKGLFIEIKDNI